MVSWISFISVRKLTFTFNICRRPSVCLSVTFVRPTQAIEIFGNVSTPFDLVRWPSVDIQLKFYGDRPRGTIPPLVRQLCRYITVYFSF